MGVLVLKVPVWKGKVTRSRGHGEGGLGVRIIGSKGQGLEIMD